jgi:hypothetical protein
VGRRVTVLERHRAGDAEVDGARPGGGQERGTDVDPGAGDAVVAAPGAEHLAAAAAQVEQALAGPQVDGAAERRQLLFAERVVDAVTAFPDDELAR